MKRAFKSVAFFVAASVLTAASLSFTACANKFEIEVPTPPEGLELTELERWQNDENYRDFAVDGLRRNTDIVFRYYGSEEENFERSGSERVTEHKFWESGINYNFVKDDKVYADISAAYRSESQTKSGKFSTHFSHEASANGGNLEVVRTSQVIESGQKSETPAQLITYYQSNKEMNGLDLFNYYVSSHMDMYSDVQNVSEYIADYTDYCYNYQKNQPANGVYVYYPYGAVNDGSVMTVVDYDCSVKTDKKHMYLDYTRTYRQTKIEGEGVGTTKLVTNRIVVYVAMDQGQRPSSLGNGRIDGENTKRVTYVTCDTAAAASAIKDNGSVELTLHGGSAAVKSGVRVMSEIHYKNGSVTRGDSLAFPENSDKLTIAASALGELDKAEYVQLTAVGSGTSQALTSIVIYL